MEYKVIIVVKYKNKNIKYTLKKYHIINKIARWKTIYIFYEIVNKP